MSIYQSMYLTLFRAMTKALEAISQHNYGLAEQLLIQAQQAAEEQFLSQEET